MPLFNCIKWCRGFVFYYNILTNHWTIVEFHTRNLVWLYRHLKWNRVWSIFSSLHKYILLKFVLFVLKPLATIIDFFSIYIVLLVENNIQYWKFNFMILERKRCRWNLVEWTSTVLTDVTNDHLVFFISTNLIRQDFLTAYLEG